jgi:hypothetical protein
MSSMRCKVSGCDLDPCGVCLRCDSEAKARHDWQDVDRERECYAKRVCSRCQRERESPDHDWSTSTGPAGDLQMKCSRCGLAI